MLFVAVLLLAFFAPRLFFAVRDTLLRPYKTIAPHLRTRLFHLASSPLVAFLVVKSPFRTPAVFVPGM